MGSTYLCLLLWKSGLAYYCIYYQQQFNYFFVRNIFVSIKYSKRHKNIYVYYCCCSSIVYFLYTTSIQMVHVLERRLFFPCYLWNVSSCSFLWYAHKFTSLLKTFIVLEVVLLGQERHALCLRCKCIETKQCSRGLGAAAAGFGNSIYRFQAPF